MSRRLLAPLVLVLLAVATPATAEAVRGKAISDLVAGRKVLLSTPYGLEFPLRYRADGTVTGDASGFTLARMFSPRETGRWWVDDSRLCQQWPSWYDGRTFCFTIARTAPNRISWVRDDGVSGTARIEG